MVTFDLPQQTPETSQNTEVETQESNIRKSVRNRCPKQHLQVDPQLKSYKRQNLKGRGCSDDLSIKGS